MPVGATHNSAHDPTYGPTYGGRYLLWVLSLVTPKLGKITGYYEQITEDIISDFCMDGPIASQLRAQTALAGKEIDVLGGLDCANMLLETITADDLGIFHSPLHPHLSFGLNRSNNHITCYGRPGINPLVFQIGQKPTLFVHKKMLSTYSTLAGQPLLPEIKQIKSAFQSVEMQLTNSDAQQLASLISKAEQLTSPFCTPKDDVLMVSLPANTTDTVQNRFTASDSHPTLQQQQQSFIESPPHSPTDASTASGPSHPSHFVIKT